MSLKKCKECGDKVSSLAKVCPHCGVKTPAKASSKGALLFILGFLLVVLGLTGPRTSTHSAPSNVTKTEVTAPIKSSKQQEASLNPYGNNVEANDFAKAMSSISHLAKWYLELTPSTVTGKNVEDYRRNVTYCKATITMDQNEWFRIKETSQKNWISSAMHALHHAPLLPLNDKMEWYPNSTGEVTLYVGGQIVATGKYTASGNEIKLEPGTYQPDDINKYHISISIVFDPSKGGVRFSGNTNHPDGSILFTLSRKEDDYRAQSKVTVVQGHFSTETFSNQAKSLPFGTYVLYLNTINPSMKAEWVVTIPSASSDTLTFIPTKKY
jgi:hypothetical protein